MTIPFLLPFQMLCVSTSHFPFITGHADLTPSMSSKSKSKAPIGAIVGGILGGLIVIGLAGGISAVIILRRRRMNLSLKHTTRTGPGLGGGMMRPPIHGRSTSDLSMRSFGAASGYMGMQQSAAGVDMLVSPANRNHRNQSPSIHPFPYSSPSPPLSVPGHASPPPTMNRQDMIDPFLVTQTSYEMDRKTSRGEAMYPTYDSPSVPPAATRVEAAKSDMGTSRPRLNPPAYTHPGTAIRPPQVQEHIDSDRREPGHGYGRRENGSMDTQSSTGSIEATAGSGPSYFHPVAGEPPALRLSIASPNDRVRSRELRVVTSGARGENR